MKTIKTLKVKNILLATALTLLFTAGAQAEQFKTKMCIIAETTFWDTYKEPYDRTNYNFLDSEDKISQIKLAKSNLELAMDNVSNRCKRIDKVITSQYEKLQRDLLKELIKVQESL
jgi:hypothetical protein